MNVIDYLQKKLDNEVSASVQGAIYDTAMDFLNLGKDKFLESIKENLSYYKKCVQKPNNTIPKSYYEKLIIVYSNLIKVINS